MLTLNEPIKLNCCDSRLSLAEGFCERILGNYALMGASFGPKDLLFLLTTPPDFPDDLGGMTTFSAQTNISDNRSVVLDVVNHVVNRVLLSSQPGFTYQDQVYLTTALNKLGITDVTQFMSEVRSLREEERSVATLLSLYREESRRAATAPASKGTADGRSIALSPGGEAVAPLPAPRYYLHGDIYHRLQTGAIYESLNAHNRNMTQVSQVAQSQLLRMSEELRVSNLLTLNDLRTQTFRAAPLTLSQRLNHYELGDLLPPPTDEATVLSQAAEAALFSTVEHVLVQNLSETIRGGDLWQDLREVLSQTVENSLSRYESYHGETTIHVGAGERAYHTLLTDLYWEETQLIHAFRTSKDTLEREMLVAAQPGADGAAAIRRERLETKHMSTLRDIRAVSELEQELVTLMQEPPDLRRLLLDTTQIVALRVGDAATNEHTTQTEKQVLQTERHLVGAKATPEDGATLPHGGEAAEYPIQELIYRRGGETEGETPPAPPHAVHKETGIDGSTPRPTTTAPGEGSLSVLIPPPSGEAVPKTNASKPDDRATELIYRHEGETEGEVSPTLTHAVHGENAPGGSPSRPTDTAPGDGPLSVRLPPLERDAMPTTGAVESDYPTQELIYRHEGEAEGEPDAPAKTPSAKGTVGEGAGGTGATSSTEGRPSTRPTAEGSTTVSGEPLPVAEASGGGEGTVVPDAGTILREILHHEKTVVGETIAPLLVHPETLPVEGETAGGFPAAQDHPSPAEILHRQRERVLEQVRSTSHTTTTLSGEALPAAALGGFTSGERDTVRRILAPESGEERETLLLRELARLDQRNRENFERLHESRTEHTHSVTASVPDRAKIMADALRAVDAPEQVLRELLLGTETARVQPLTETELLLSHTDQTTRTILEQAMLRERDPDAVARQGILRPATLGALNSEQTRQQREALELISRLEESIPGVTAVNATVSDFATRQLSTARQLGATGPLGAARPHSAAEARHSEREPAPLHFVHKQEQDAFSQESMALFEEQRRSTRHSQEIEERVYHQTTTQTQTADVSRQMAAQSAEDVATLVNRTLARQMNVITEKVYQQMEKKLQVERQRRGRF